MKKLLWLSIVLSLLITTRTFAITGTLKATYDASLSRFNATLSGVKGSPSNFKIYILDKEFPGGTEPNDVVKSNAILNDGTVKKPDAVGTITWALNTSAALKFDHAYYIRAVEVGYNGRESYASAAVKVTTPAAAKAAAAGKVALQPLVLTAKGTVVTGTLSDVPMNAKYKLISQKTAFSSSQYAGSDSALSAGVVSPTAGPVNLASGTASVGSVSFNESNYLQNTKYYIRAIEIPADITIKPFYISDTVTVTTAEDTIALVPLTTKKDGDSIIVSGKIDTSKLTSTFIPEDYTVTLSASKTPPKTGTNDLATVDVGPLPSAKTEKGDVPGINADGTYYWKLSSLSPSTVYYYQQSATVKGNKVPVKGSVANFNSNVGTTIVPGSAEEKADLNKRSYTLLSGFPNFSVLPDPDLCAQQRAAGENPRFCDMNDVINYFMKLLIGLCAVSLVFRIMYEGFVYMTSDMPFKVASAKSSLYAAILGLLLALTSYIILNTINPKLVDGTVSVDQLGIGVEIVGDGSTSFNLGTKTKGLPTPVYCPGSGGRAQLSKIAMSFQNNVVYNQTLRNSLQPNGKVALDCSSYVAQVLNCAGYTIPGVSTSNTNTASIFGGSGAEKISTISSANGVVTVNNKVLQVGDLLGWTGSKGHVVMYIGGGQIIEVHGPKGSITNAKVWPSIDWYQKNYGFKSVYRIPN